ncbi:MAG: zinc-ribbon domain-containing protein [Deltaproteobacteria bacterium]|nr:zinc-ribbon domain-containing protein [Deltaproteobacteria bacterium]
MLVQCPNCRTTYRVSDSLVTTSEPTFRCSRCKHIFLLRLESKKRTAEERTSVPSGRDSADNKETEELAFSFPHRKQKEEESPTPSQPPEEPERAISGISAIRDSRTAPPAVQDDPAGFESSSGVRTAEPEAEPTAAEGRAVFPDSPDEGWSMGGAGLPNEKVFAISQKEAGTKELPKDTSSVTESTANREPSFIVESKTRLGSASDEEERVSILPYLSLFGCLLILYSSVTFLYQSHPKIIDNLLRAVPLLGDSVFKNNHLKQGIALASVRPGYQKIVGNREVFVVFGTAVNHNPMSVRQVRVEAQIFDAQGKEIEKQVVSVGNAVSAKIIRDMSFQEISILQQQSPMKRFEIPPDDSAKFVVVFLKPGREVKHFTCRVVSAVSVI